MKLTKNGICYDLSISPYYHVISYSDQRVKFMFSSKLNVDKFIDRLDSNRKQINGSLSNRFKIDIQYNILCDVMLYEKIENRGFHIIVDGKEYEWLEEVALDGMKMMRRN